MAAVIEKSKPDWDVESAINTYNVDGWGSGYFTVNAAGNAEARPLQEGGGSIDILEVVNEARERGLGFPLVIRFQDLLRHRVVAINRAFQAAIGEFGYKNQYRGVFPIKVNQLREVIEEIVDAGQEFHFGLEAGSKPELIAALAMHTDLQSLIICNGYKDRAYIRSAMLGRKLGKSVVIVVEKIEELEQTIRIARDMGVEPQIGIRVRLHSKGFGKWTTSGGENAKFGLDTTSLVAASDLLKAEGMAHCLKLLHFHVGSQVPDISTIKRAVREAARYYAKLSKLGHELGYVDVGGGLAVDYDGSRTTFDSSMNYSLQEYANDVVWNIMDVCDSEGVAHPAIVSESGRAIVAHHSVLVVEAFGAIEKNAPDAKAVAPAETDHKLVRDILDVQQKLRRNNRRESLHDAQQIKEESQQMFSLGLLELPSKAKIESVYWQLAEQIVAMHRGLRYVPEEVKELETSLGDQYICNFSVFQSLLDHWALGQLFPIMPIHRLDTPPDRNGTMVDITCDSDGKISKFIDLQDVRETLPLHPIVNGEMYYIGVFMVGAYQDIMGDLHNLFGRVTEVHVFLDPDEESGWYIEEVIEGSTIGQVLALTQWDKIELMRLVKAQVDAAIKSDRLKPNDAMKLLADYERGLTEYTYLSLSESQPSTRNGTNSQPPLF
ncbi:MAG: Biosynthetic arginine decarboxylase [uncultured Chthoniobacterales bacterium]|uniref:Biosynthetic arginine decarboxylase n=1 Tax=uncultured Chthoniobacterales bacterium TaxID=1836801 RepID=A0A6J4IJW0_9BACT|nr:MAG: Biosynthetic arginine decarboxylase [uncultured Chthoniobacterales bacterium]